MFPLRADRTWTYNLFIESELIYQLIYDVILNITTASGKDGIRTRDLLRDRQAL